LDYTHYMKLALSMAESTQGQTSPNPMVGAVVVKNGEIVGMGAHLKAGKGHAEVHAIKTAGDKAKGSDVYITLEPCSHYGKTPPCSRLLISSGVKRVHIATRDPNPLVAGRGIQQLRDAGIEVVVGELEEEARELNKHFFHFIQNGSPYVTLKTAVTLDGKTASASGDSKWITSEASRTDVHYDRHRHDAILVGVNTVIQDNPHLTTRLPQGGKNPIRIILDTFLRTPIHSHVVEDLESRTIIFTGNSVNEEQKKPFIDRGCEIISLTEEKIGIHTVLKELGTRNIVSLYVEGGSAIHSAFLKNKAFQELIMYMSPKLVGGNTALPSFGGEGFPTIAEGLEMEIATVDRVGEDIKIVALPKSEPM
jgi:diaminohydroxyphosphoribosylaminopyrimidine deaminase / 5-amino-6-(5-phosphoribosylamino)uracil reductase